MIERLNFYDVYGYLIPGLGLLGVLWFPFWVVAGHTLPAAWSSALAALVVSYIAGHVLQQLARNALPQGKPDPSSGTSKTGWWQRNRRVPSDYLLDDTDSTLGPETRAGIIALTQARLGLAVAADGLPDEATRKRRQQAFELCRRILIQEEVGSYSEQFQGMYALMRGLAAAAWLSAWYHLGWAFGRVVTPALQEYLAIVILVALLAALIGLHRWWVFWVIAAALLPLGALLGYRFGPGPKGTTLILTALVLGSLVVVRIFSASYEFFAGHFAATVYRDVYALERWAATGQRQTND